MLQELKGSLSALLDPVLVFLEAVQHVVQLGLDQLHIEYGAQLVVIRIGWAMVVLLLVGLTRGYLRLIVLLAVILVLLKAYGYF